MRNAAQRHLLDLVEGPARGLFWDLPAALRVIEFFPDVLKLSQSFAGEKFQLEPSQKFIVGSIFGWKNGREGPRRFRRAFIEISKGSGKSVIAGGIGLYCLVADGEAQAQVYSAASQKAQARVVFDFAVQMWRQSPALFRRLTPSGGNPVWNLADLKTGSFFRPVSTDEGKFSGPMPSCALCDEVHEHRDGSIVEMLELGFKSRRQPLLLMITNSGSDRHTVCWREHVRAIQVAAGSVDVGPNATDATFVGGVVDDAEFAFVAGLDADDDPFDEAVWPKANPMLGITMPIAEMRRSIAQGKAIPGTLNNVLRLQLCQWTDADQAWMARPTLEAVLADFDPAEHTSEEVYLGVDLSATQDLTAISFVVPTGFDEEQRPTFDAWVEVWTPADTLAERAIRDERPYGLWVEQGHLQTTPGKVIGFDFVAARIAEVVGLYGIKSLAYDVYGFNKHFEPQLDALGLTLPIVEHPQGGKRKGKDSGLWMPGSKLTLESLILERRIRIQRNPVMVAAMMSAATENDPFGNFWFSKRKATNRIDALVALAMAVGAATSGEKAMDLDDFLLNAVVA